MKNDDKSDKKDVSLSRVVGDIVLLACSMLANGYVTTILWAWFLAPWLHIALSLKTAVGIHLLVNVWTTKFDQSNETSAWLRGWPLVIGFLLAGLGLGWLYKTVLP